MKKHFGKWLTKYKLLFFLFPYLVVAQVNTEKFRLDNNKKGFSGNITFGLNVTAGNSEYVNFEPSLRLNYNTTNFTNFIISSYNRKQSNVKTDKEYLLVHKGFTHIRSTRLLNMYVSIEVFGQFEFNDFIRLEQRFLTGTGVRLESLQSLKKIELIFGIGGMIEKEIYDICETSLFRSTNYLTFTWKFTNYGLLTSTTYFQIVPYILKDFRIISENTLMIKLTSWLTLGIDIKLRYDNDQIVGVKKKYDFELSNNLTIVF